MSQQHYTVKPLEWELIHSDIHPEMWKANTAAGKRHVWRTGFGRLFHGEQWGDPCDSIEHGKQLCQEIHNAALLQHLTPVSCPAWHERPTEPGWWMLAWPGNATSLVQVDPDDVGVPSANESVMWFGPIPERKFQ